jgi:hypothetical protein
MFQTKSLRKIQILNHFNFSLSLSLYSLFSSLSLHCLRWTPRPTATGRALAVPPATPSRSLLKLLITTRRNPRRARRGSTPSRHDEAVPSLPSAHHPLLSILPSICFTSELSTSPSTPLPAPRAEPSPPRRPELPPPPFAPPAPWLPRSSPFRPSSRSTDPLDSSTSPPRTSYTRPPPPFPSGTPPPPVQFAAGRPFSRRGHHGPRPRVPSPSKGSSCSPLSFPLRIPRRRRPCVQEMAPPLLLCFAARGLPGEEAKSPGGQMQKRHKLKTANFDTLDAPSA